MMADCGAVVCESVVFLLVRSRTSGSFQVNRTGNQTMSVTSFCKIRELARLAGMDVCMGCSIGCGRMLDACSRV